MSSPVLPLPVEFVAGGDGRPEPEPFDAAPGLGGGSGRSGKLLGEETEPRKIADKGRALEETKEGRVVIGKF